MALSRAARQYLGVRAILPPDLQMATRAPTSSDRAYVKGTLWLDTAASSAYMWPGTGDWISLGSGTTGAIVTLTGDSGGAISPVGGNIDILGGAGVTVVGTAGTLTISLTGGGLAIDSFVPDAGTDPVVPDADGKVTMAGTANQITTTGGLNSLTFSIPAAFIAPGSIVATTSIASTTTLAAGTTFTATGGASSFGGGTFTVATGTAAINISADAAATTVNIGTGAGVKAVTVGSTNTTSATTVQSGSGGITLTGAVTASSNVTLNGAASKLSVHGGAVTDFIGTGTLTAGTQTINNTNIAAGDRIFISRISPSTSTALGVFSYSISAGASFTVTSLNPTDASTETNDVSTYAYFIVRQV